MVKIKEFYFRVQASIGKSDSIHSEKMGVAVEDLLLPRGTNAWIVRMLSHFQALFYLA